MTLTQEQIKKISQKLSKIPLKDWNTQNQINEILKYFELLNEVDTKNIEPTYCVISKENNPRKDELTKKEISRQQLLNCSEQQIIADQIAISNIMK